MTRGVPWHVVFGADSQALTNEERMAFLIMIGENEGLTFDWSTLRWKKPE